MIVLVSGLVAATLHFLFFMFESVLWSWSRVAIFRIPQAEREGRSLRLFAYNMGFYNLFLCVGALAGLYLLPEGKLLLSFACASMVCAGGVLFLSRPGSLVGPLTQSVPPAICLWGLWH